MLYSLSVNVAAPESEMPALTIKPTARNSNQAVCWCVHAEDDNPALIKLLQRTEAGKPDMVELPDSELTIPARTLESWTFGVAEIGF
jgi:hypothetical protein